MRNLKIGKKLLLTFGVIILLFTATVGTSLYSLISVGNNFQDFYENGYPVSISIVTLAATILQALYITRSLTKPISEIEAAASDLAAGKLDTSVTYQSRDELGKLSDTIRDLTESLRAIILDEDYILGEMADGNFNVNTRISEKYVGEFQGLLQSMIKINTKLSDTIGQINQSAEQVASGSEQVSSGAQALSQGATEQASSIEELAASITEITGQVQRNADNAAEASKTAQEVGEKMTESNQQMQQMIQAMNDISENSNQISKIIKTIEDIAFQTNILALNAAVEADVPDPPERALPYFLMKSATLLPKARKPPAILPH